MKKRVFTFLMAALMVVSLVACGKKPEEANDQLAAIQKAGKIIVGVEGTYYPYTYHDEKTNELDGYDIQVAKLLAKKLGNLMWQLHLALQMQYELRMKH